MSLEAWGDENPADAEGIDHLIEAGWLAPDDADALKDENAHLRRTIKAFLAKYKECEPYLVDAFSFQMIHGLKYDGPNWSEELAALTALVLEPTP